MTLEANLMHDPKLCTIRRDSARSRSSLHRDGGNVRERHRVYNRDACGEVVGNKSLEPIQCHRNTNRVSAYAHGDLGDYLVGRGVDRRNNIGVSRGDKKGGRARGRHLRRLGQSRG